MWSPRPYDVTVQAVSKHLTVLEVAGLVRRTGDGQRRPVPLEAEVLDLLTTWLGRYRRRAEERHRRLDAMLASMDEQHVDRGPDSADNDHGRTSS